MKSIHIMCIIVLVAISCSKKFDITDHFDPTQSFQFVDIRNHKNDVEIQVNDLKHDQLLSWLELNNQNWEPTDASHAALLIINQEKFKLMFYRNKDLMVIRFTDDENILHQYKKIIDPDGLNFLFEE